MKPDRRRLLKGSLAAPLVLTVRPASATAITSAAACFDRCGIIAQEKRPPKLAAVMHTDEWMRVECDVFRLAPAMGKDHYSGKYFLGFDRHTYWRLDDRNPYHGAAQPSHYTKGSCYAEKTGQKVYGIAYVDKSGTIKGFAWDNHHHGTPVTWSCYTSAIGMKHKA